MNLNLRLTEKNIGDIILLETDDNFSVNGEIINVTETNVGIRDIETNIVLTIFLFQIYDVKILKKKTVDENKFRNRIKMQKKVIGPESLINIMVDIEKLDNKKYYHPIFGKLSHDENQLIFSQLERPKKNDDINVCQYIIVNSRNDVYNECLEFFELSSVIGVCFFESKVRWKHLYLIMSCSSFSLLVDLIDMDFDQIRSNYCELLNLIGDKKPLKVVYSARNLFHFLNKHCGTKMDHFVDLQVMHYGLHNIRAAKPMRHWLSYTAMVESLFNVTFNMVGDAYFTSEDALHKLAYNVHFLVPIYEIMMARFMEPVKIISKRLCSKNIEDVVDDLDMNNDESHCISVLPRGLQFWSYCDGSEDNVDVEEEGGGCGERDVGDDNLVRVKDITRVMHQREVERTKDISMYWGDRIDDEDNIEYYDSPDILWGKDHVHKDGLMERRLSEEVRDRNVLTEDKKTSDNGGYLENNRDTEAVEDNLRITVFDEDKENENFSAMNGRDTKSKHRDNMENGRDTKSKYHDNVENGRDTKSKYHDNVENGRDTKSKHRDNVENGRDTKSKYRDNVENEKDTKSKYHETMGIVRDEIMKNDNIGTKRGPMKYNWGRFSKYKKILNDVSNIIRMNVSDVVREQKRDNIMEILKNERTSVDGDNCCIVNGSINNDNDDSGCNVENYDNGCTVVRGDNNVRQYPIRLRKRWNQVGDIDSEKTNVDDALTMNDDVYDDIATNDCCVSMNDSTDVGIGGRDNCNDDDYDNDADDGLVCDEGEIIDPRRREIDCTRREDMDRERRDIDHRMMEGCGINGEDLKDIDELLSVLSVDVDSGCAVSCHGNSLGRGMSPLGLVRPSCYQYCESLVARHGSDTASTGSSITNNRSIEEVNLCEGPSYFRRSNNWERLHLMENIETGTSKNEALGIIWNIEEPAAVRRATKDGHIRQLEG